MRRSAKDPPRFSASGATRGRAHILLPGKEKVAVGGPPFQGEHVPFLQLGSCQGDVG